MDSERDGSLHRAEPAWPLGPLEERILRAIWQEGPSTVRQVRMLLLAERAIAYTTTMTVMSRLAEKGLLRRTITTGSYVYDAVFSEAAYAALVSARLTRDLVARFGDHALAHFAAELERLDPMRLDRLRRLAGEEPEA